MVAVVIIVIVAVGSIVSTRIHPLRKCPTCNMTGRHFGDVYTGSYRRCRKCDGSGRRDRMGTKVFFGKTPATPGSSRRSSPRGEACGARPRPRCPAGTVPRPAMPVDGHCMLTGTAC